jgi:hypothetical protein
MKQTDIMKEVGRLWNLLGSVEKKKFEIEASKGKLCKHLMVVLDKERYQREM